MDKITLSEARAAKASAIKQLRTVAEVTGVGITRVEGNYAVKVNLSAPVAPGVELPTHIGRVPIRFEIVGAIRPYS